MISNTTLKIINILETITELKEVSILEFTEDRNLNVVNYPSAYLMSTGIQFNQDERSSDYYKINEMFTLIVYLYQSNNVDTSKSNSDLLESICSKINNIKTSFALNNLQLIDKKDQQEIWQINFLNRTYFNTKED
jgi:hypothetical protein